MASRLLNTEELDAVCGGNGVIAGPNGEGCIPPLFPTPPLVPGLPEWLDSLSV